MTRKVLLFSALIAVTLVLTLPTIASSPVGQGSAKAMALADRSAVPAPVAPDQVRWLKEVGPDDMKQDSADSWCKLYWKVKAYNCVCGSRIDLWIGGTYMGSVTKTGTYYVGKAVNGYKYKFYARDSGLCVYWSKKYYINYSKFTWTIFC